MRVRIKFVVPLRMPANSFISFAARHWLIGLIIGIPPPTDASKRKFTLCSAAYPSSSQPFAATSSLFEVTTLLPALRQAETNSYAG